MSTYIKRAAAIVLTVGATPRAITGLGVRASADDAKTVLAELIRTVEAMRSENNLALKSKADVVVAEKVDRINDDVGKIQSALDAIRKDQQASIDDLTIRLAAVQQNTQGALPGDLKPTSPEVVADFKAHMRTGDVKASLSKSTDAEGGYLAPVEWDRTIVDKLKQISPIRQNARVVSISVAGFRKLFNDRVVGSGWVGETAARPVTSTPAIGTLDFTPGELYANPAISQQLLDDSAIDIQQWLASEVNVEFARQEGIAFLSGDGTNKPYGILTYVTGAANAARHPWGAIGTVASGHASQLTGDGIIDLMYSLPSEFSGNAKLYLNRSSLKDARKLKDGQGNYLWQPSYAAGQPQTLNGAPIVEASGMPAVAANAIAALYGDMEQTYLVVDRVGISVLRDPYTNKPFVHFYTVKRVGGGVYNPEPMRALKVAAA